MNLEEKGAVIRGERNESKYNTHKEISQKIF